MVVISSIICTGTSENDSAIAGIFPAIAFMDAVTTAQLNKAIYNNIFLF